MSLAKMRRLQDQSLTRIRTYQLRSVIGAAQSGCTLEVSGPGQELFPRRPQAARGKGEVEGEVEMRLRLLSQVADSFLQAARDGATTIQVHELGNSHG